MCFVGLPEKNPDHRSCWTQFLGQVMGMAPSDILWPFVWRRSRLVPEVAQRVRARP